MARLHGIRVAVERLVATRGDRLQEFMSAKQLPTLIVSVVALRSVLDDVRLAREPTTVETTEMAFRRRIVLVHGNVE